MRTVHGGLGVGLRTGLVVGLVLTLGACTLARAPDRGPEPPPAETHVCTQAPDGLAVCREIGPMS